MIKTIYENKDIEFKEDAEKKTIYGRLYGIFEFEIEVKSLLNIAQKYSLENNCLTLYDEVEKEHYLVDLINYKIKNELINTVDNRKAIFIDDSYDMPIVGSNSIGIVDRNTSLIEIKPITGCNINCVFCSLNEGCVIDDKIDLVIEEKYFINKLKEHIENYRKDCSLEMHINCNGEALLYSRIYDLLKDLKKIKEVSKISIDTNAVGLTYDDLVKLKESGLDQINISIHSLDKAKARLISGTNTYDIDKIKETILYAKQVLDVILAPVWVSGLNDEDIEQLIQFAKENNLRIGIQNYLQYKSGRNIAKELPWAIFYKKLEEYEQKYDLKLILNADDFNVIKLDHVKKPFKKNNVVEAFYVCEGHFPNTYLFAKDNRLITVYKNDSKTRIKDVMKIKIISDKHNIFNGSFV